MVFSSTVFLFVFLPVTWLLYLLIPARAVWARNLLLGIVSLLFYAYGEPVYIILMVASVFTNYIFARCIEFCGDKGYRGRKRGLTVFSVVVNLFLLGFFKYVPWLCSLIEEAAGIHIALPALTLPVGISFYTFQILSYVLDVSRGRSRAQKNPFDLLLYISFFPQLIAGPIVAYEDIRVQLHQRTVTVEKTAVGIRRFIYGLSKKVLISNTAALIADTAFAASAPTAAAAWAGAICYSMQIYFDFSGYSDMAIGLAAMFGFDILENFNYPYSAVTIRDFWRRWHISLTSWFRDYVYIPLGGNRISTRRTVLNRFIVFFLTGIWHGANFTYILWGLWHGALQMLEWLCHFERLEKKTGLRPLLRLYTLLSVCLGFVVFRAPGIGEAFSFIGAMFSPGGTDEVWGLFTPYAVVVLLFGVLLSMPLLPYLRKKAAERGLSEGLGALEYVICIPLLCLCVMTLASSAFNPFIYYIF